MFLFQVYPRHSAQYLPLLLPLLLEAVSLTGPSAEDVMPALLSPYYSDFRIAQVRHRQHSNWLHACFTFPPHGRPWQLSALL